MSKEKQMESVKKTKEHEIFKKRSGRFAVRNAEKKWINGTDKANILHAAGLIKLTPPTKKEEPAAEAPAETAAEASKEA